MPSSDRLPPQPDGPHFPARRTVAVAVGFGGLALAAFLYLAPLAYGTPISDAAFNARLRLIERAR